jgi:hypothetical protein
MHNFIHEAKCSSQNTSLNVHESESLLPFPSISSGELAGFGDEVGLDLLDEVEVSLREPGLLVACQLLLLLLVFGSITLTMLLQKIYIWRL